MKKSAFFVRLATLLSVGVVLLAPGCASKRPQAWNISMTKTTRATIQVDLIGIPLQDKPQWQAQNISQYWEPNSRVRDEADKLSFDLELNKPVVLEAKNPKWQQWFDHGAKELLIIANLPGSNFPPGAGDPRCKFLPLRKKDWEPSKKNTLEIEVQQTRIHVLTPESVN
jgi:hypothetical protein